MIVAAPEGHLIGGAWRRFAREKRRVVINPADGTTLAAVDFAEREAVDAAVDAAAHALRDPAWAGLPPLAREAMMHRLADLMARDADQLARLECLNVGKPLGVAASVDVPAAISWVRYMAGWASKLDDRRFRLSMHPDAYHAYTMRSPVGVVGLITPWNYPLVLAVWKLAPALAAGCTVVLKPSEITPLSTLHLAALCQEAGFPPGVVNVVVGEGATAGAALVEHPKVAKIAFTGSTRTGAAIARACGGDLKRVSLELGGKSPTFIFADADLEGALSGALQNGFFNTGQSCFAGTRVFIERPLFERALEHLVEAAQRIAVGPGLEPATQLGPLVSEAQRDRVHGMVVRAQEAGARVACGGGPLDGPGFFYAPTIVTGVEETSELFQEEVFGPVLAVAPFDGEDEAVRLANATRYGLCAYVWTGDVARGHRLATKIDAGGVWVNCHTVVDPAMPFGGFKHSGIGRENGPEVFAQYTEVKSVCVKL